MVLTALEGARVRVRSGYEGLACGDNAMSGSVRSMERSSWERALARAVVDRSFQARLLADPAATLSDYGLTLQDRPLVDALRKTPTLAQLAAGFLHLAATAWAQPASSSRRYAGDPFLTPYPSLRGSMEGPWTASALMPLDQLPPSTSHARGIAIKTLQGRTEGPVPGMHAGIRVNCSPEKLPQRPRSLPGRKTGDDVVNF